MVLSADISSAPVLEGGLKAVCENQ